MKPRYRAYRREDRDGMYYYKDSVTGDRESLETKDPEEAERLVSHMNETLKNPRMNHRIGVAYLSAADRDKGLTNPGDAEARRRCNKSPSRRGSCRRRTV